MIVELYRKKIPENIRNVIYKMVLGDFLRLVRGRKEIIPKLSYRFRFFIKNPKDVHQKILKKWAEGSFFFKWNEEYRNEDISINYENGMPYVWHNKRKLYFKKDHPLAYAQVYNSLLIEQDARSAHRYVSDYESLRGKVLLDVGAAEAIFTLDVIDYIDHAYIFECDESWIEALEKTFEPWKDKVKIVRKYVSDIDNDDHITLDTFFKDKPKDNLFLKMDIEGYERKALKGASGLLQSTNMMGSVCIYHLYDDERVISNIIKNQNKKMFVHPGYMIFEHEMRHAILRFE